MTMLRSFLFALVLLLRVKPILAQQCTACWCVPRNFDKQSKQPHQECPPLKKREPFSLPPDPAQLLLITRFAKFHSLVSSGVASLGSPPCQPYPDLATILDQEECGRLPEPRRKQVCGFKYSNTDGCKKLPAPRIYELKTYNSKRKAIADGAIITHKGPCGVCSNHQDLAVYLIPGLLDRVSATCGLGFADLIPPEFPLKYDVGMAFDDVTDCYNTEITKVAPGLALTSDCVHVWASNNLKTATSCYEQPCNKWEGDSQPVKQCCKTALGLTGTPPWPPNNLTTCQINGCLKCDEENSGEVFKKYAGRTRRNSGIVGLVIKRPCKSIANLNQDPCANPKKK